MGSFSRLLSRLHSVFNKDAEAVDVISVTSTLEGHEMTASGLSLSINKVINEGNEPSPVTSGSGSTSGSGATAGGLAGVAGKITEGVASVDISQITLSQLVDAINALPDFSATLLRADMGSFLARGVLEEVECDVPGVLRYPTSILWTEMQTYGWALDEQATLLGLAEDQLSMDTAAEDWLDHWARDWFGVERMEGEADEAYAQRAIYEVIRPRANNIALSSIIKDAFGVDARLIDALPVAGSLSDPAQAPCHFLLEMSIPNDLSAAEAQALIDAIKALVRRYKAAGTDFLDGVIEKLNKILESVTVSDAGFQIEATVTLSETLLPGPIRYGDGWVYGTPGLLYGDNDPIKEQIVVQTLDTGGATLSTALYGE